MIVCRYFKRPSSTAFFSPMELSQKESPVGKQVEWQIASFPVSDKDHGLLNSISISDFIKDIQVNR
jgi:hypothetical protein